MPLSFLRALKSSEGREIALVPAVRDRPPPSRAPPASTGVPSAAALVVLAVLLGHRLLLHSAHRVHVVRVGLVLLLGLLSLRLRLLLLLLVRLRRDGHDVRLLVLRVLRLGVLCLLGELRLLHAVPHGHSLHVGVLLEVAARTGTKKKARAVGGDKTYSGE